MFCLTKGAENHASGQKTNINVIIFNTLLNYTAQQLLSSLNIICDLCGVVVFIQVSLAENKRSRKPRTVCVCSEVMEGDVSWKWYNVFLFLHRHYSRRVRDDLQKD